MPKFKSKFGFTLIELLVVIAVIALLVTLSILALSNARLKARDSKRVADIKQMQTALEMFYDANDRYPTSAEFQSGRLAYFDSKTGTTTFISIPTAPTPADGSCTDVTNAYTYVPTADGSNYALNFCTAKKINDIPAGTLAATPGGIVSVAPPAPLAFSAQHLAFIGDSSTYFDYPFSVFATGTYAYVVNYNSNSLEIVDTANPANPVHKGNIFAGDGGAKIGYPQSVYVSGNYAYIVGTNSNSLEIVDVSNQASPKHSGSITETYPDDLNGPSLSSPVSVFVSGNYAYVVSTGYNALEIVDISSSTNPTHAGKLLSGDGDSLFNTPTSVYVSGNYAYVTGRSSNSLEIVDITDPAHPRHAGNIPYDSDGAALYHPETVYVSGDYAYVTGGSSAVEIVDVSSSTKPVHKSALSYGNDGILLFVPSAVFVSGNYAYILSGPGNALEIVDISDPENPVHKGTLSNSNGGAFNTPRSISVSGNYAYVANYNNNSLEIVDISDSENPVHKGNLTNNDNIKLIIPRSVYVSGNYAYVASQAPGSSLQVVDVSSPANPAYKGNIVTGGDTKLTNPYSVQVVGNYAYLASYTSGALEIINIANASIPAHFSYLLKGSTASIPPKLTTPNSVYVSGNHVYAVGGSNALEIVNISDTASPTPAHDGYLNNGDPTSETKLAGGHSVQVAGNYAYVVGGTTAGALEIVDISSSTHPVHVSSISNGAESGAVLLNNPQSIFILGNYAYIASYSSNALEIIDISNPSLPTHKGSLTNGAGGALLGGAQSVYVSGNYAFVASVSSNALEIVDVSDPAHPKHKISVVNGAGGAKLYKPYSVFVSGNYVYVASQGSKGLEIISLTGN